MRKNKIVCLLVITAILLSGLGAKVYAEVGQAAVWGMDNVDSGGHMDFTENTKYDSYIFSGYNLWNTYLGSTVIREDSASTISDCSISDVARSDVVWAGITACPSIVEGWIYYNTYFMDQYSTTKIIFVVKHEFGHCLGCDENSCSDLNIMYPSVKSNINLTIHDKASVDLARNSW